MPYLALIVCTVIWGATFPATKIVLDQTPPFTFLFLRFLLGTILVFIPFLVLFPGTLKVEKSVLRMSAITTVFLFIGYAAQTVGLQYTTASNSAFITALYVVLVPLFLQRFESRIWISAGLALVGLWFLANPSVSMNQGDLWSLLCAAGFAGHIACLETFARAGQSPSFLAWQLMMMTVFLIPATGIEGPALTSIDPTQPLLIALFICGILATGALALQIWGQKFIPAQQVALIFILEPVFAGLMSWFFLEEQLGPEGWVGCSLILLAVCLGSLSTQQEARPMPPLSSEAS